MINLDDLREVGTKQAGSAAVYILIFGCLFTAAVFVFGAIGNFNPVWLAAFVFAACGLAAFAVGLALFLLNAWQIKGIVSRAIRMLDREIDHRFPTALPAPAAPALPAAPENAKATDASGVGEGFTGRKLHGYPIITVEYVCNYLANENEWTERRMKKMPVPYVYPPALFGKAERGNPYYDFFHHEQGMFCRAGILIERGGPGNPPGKLTTTNAVEMMERIKALPEDEHGTH
jgi:hypothetical protein